MDLFNLWLCSKEFHVFFHKNKKFKKTFNHSKQILSNKNVHDESYEASKEFLLQLLSLFGFDFSKKNYVRSKKDFLLILLKIFYVFVSTATYFFVTEVQFRHIVFVLELLFKTKAYIGCYIVNCLFTKRFFNLNFQTRTYPIWLLCLFVNASLLAKDNFKLFMISIRKKLLRNLFLLLLEIYLEIVFRVFFNSVAFSSEQKSEFLIRIRQMKMILPSFIIPFQSIYVRK